MQPATGHRQLSIASTTFFVKGSLRRTLSRPEVKSRLLVTRETTGGPSRFESLNVDSASDRYSTDDLRSIATLLLLLVA